MPGKDSLLERATRTRPWLDFTVTQVVQGSATFTPGSGMTVDEARWRITGAWGALFRLKVTFQAIGQNNQKIVLSVDPTTLPAAGVTVNGPSQSLFNRPAASPPWYVGILDDDPGGTPGQDFVHYGDQANELGRNPGGFQIVAGDNWEITGFWSLP